MTTPSQDRDATRPAFVLPVSDQQRLSEPRTPAGAGYPATHMAGSVGGCKLDFRTCAACWTAWNRVLGSFAGVRPPGLVGADLLPRPRKTLGGEHPQVATTVHTLAWILKERGTTRRPSRCSSTPVRWGRPRIAQLASSRRWSVSSASTTPGAPPCRGRAAPPGPPNGGRSSRCRRPRPSPRNDDRPQKWRRTFESGTLRSVQRPAAAYPRDAGAT